jgi:hypothetical protein
MCPFNFTTKSSAKQYLEKFLSESLDYGDKDNFPGDFQDRCDKIM